MRDTILFSELKEYSIENDGRINAAVELDIQISSGSDEQP